MSVWTHVAKSSSPKASITRRGLCAFRTPTRDVKKGTNVPAEQFISMP